MVSKSYANENNIDSTFNQAAKGLKDKKRVKDSMKGEEGGVKRQNFLEH